MEARHDDGLDPFPRPLAHLTFAFLNCGCQNKSMHRLFFPMRIKSQQNLQVKQIRMHRESVDTYPGNNGIAARSLARMQLDVLSI